PLAWLLARRLTRPIGAFADAAERLGADPKAPPMAADGPAEVRAAAAAFNDMQDKLRAYLEERTSMIAAIAHDLRTPLMRLRFRLEAAPEEAREKMAADVAEMDGMISQALAFVRGETVQETRAPLDLAALAAAVVDDLAETGVAASLANAEAATVFGDPVGLRRMLANLVENAAKFGAAARVTLKVEGGRAVLTVEDDGPGLPEAELERVFEPFHRAEPSRSRDTGGVGLGLAVARSIARAHGGDIRLANRPEGGLSARADLPLA
ncbi:ATP-binding protein, partial [Caulobacter sp. 17J65-9]|uniref:ATP-binding protein n=1 Tax=Caulobacter sp. 17J65-9 TaxID=2709382 RepID=UPI0013CA3313